MLGSLVFATTSTHRNIAQSAAGSPVTPAVFAEMSRLCEAVVVVVAELGVEGLATRTSNKLIWWFQPPLRLQSTVRKQLTGLLFLQLQQLLLLLMTMIAAAAGTTHE
jgi:hypothetical protein